MIQSLSLKDEFSIRKLQRSWQSIDRSRTQKIKQIFENAQIENLMRWYNSQ